jgi:hypothetical protein
VFSLTATIPPNTTATISVPAESAAAVTIERPPGAGGTDVTFERQVKDRAVYAVQSGTYRFKARMP